MTISQFKKEWKKIRGRTLKFLESIPKNKVNWTPNKDLGTIGMQVRHIGVSQESYIKGIKNGKITFSKKSFNPEIEKNLDKGISFLKKLDEELSELLEKADPKKQIEFIDGVEGKSKITLERTLDYLIDHELYHQGIFTCYGRLLNLGKFRFM